MGQHKHNPTAIAAKNGELPPKQREKQLTKREAEVLLRRKILDLILGSFALPDGMKEILANGGTPFASGQTNADTGQFGQRTWI